MKGKKCCVMKQQQDWTLFLKKEFLQLVIYLIYRVSQNSVFKQNTEIILVLFLLIFVIFSIATTINLLLPYPVNSSVLAEKSIEDVDDKFKGKNHWSWTERKWNLKVHWGDRWMGTSIQSINRMLPPF